eukprot:11385447-Heterocapsa_arctica.AAC.1
MSPSGTGKSSSMATHSSAGRCDRSRLQQNWVGPPSQFRHCCQLGGPTDLARSHTGPARA